VQASFLEFAPHYFAHCAECGANGTDSCLSRVLGFYHVLNRNESWSLDIVVTENVFYEKELVKTFDLKGTLRSTNEKDKKASSASNHGASVEDPKNITLLDDQLRRSIMTRPLTVAPGDRHKLMMALRADTAFLARVGVMDYSLLLGIDRHNVRLASLQAVGPAPVCSQCV
jgi:1-phosphatidylinositol-3-phosphate 5-kinase